MTIGSGVISIGPGAFGYNAYLETVTFAPDSRLETIGGRTWIAATWNNPARWDGFGAFEDNTSLERINIPGSVTSIGAFAFANNTSLGSITIPASVTAVGGSAFTGWTAQQTIYIPFATMAAANAAAAQGGWGTGWRTGNNAVIRNNAGTQIHP